MGRVPHDDESGGDLLPAHRTDGDAVHARLGGERRHDVVPAPDSPRPADLDEVVGEQRCNPTRIDAARRVEQLALATNGGIHVVDVVHGADRTAPTDPVRPRDILWTCWRRWTGIEPAGRGSPVPTALKAAEPTRCSDTSVADTTQAESGLTATSGRDVASHPARLGTLDSPTPSMHPPEATGRLGERHGHTLLGRQGRQRNHGRRRWAGPEFETVVVARRPRRGDPCGARPTRTRPAGRRRLARQRSDRRISWPTSWSTSARRPGCCHGVPGRVTRRSRRPALPAMTPPRIAGTNSAAGSTTGRPTATVTSPSTPAPASHPPAWSLTLIGPSSSPDPAICRCDAPVHSAIRPTGIVLVDEPGRALSQRDVEHSLGVAVEATVSLDPAVARAVDAGLLATRLPRVIAEELRQVAA